MAPKFEGETFGGAQDSFIEENLALAESCRICRCHGDCEPPCVWTETGICSRCWGDRCSICESERVMPGKEVGPKCWDAANRLAQRRREMHTVKQAEEARAGDRLRRGSWRD